MPSTRPMLSERIAEPPAMADRGCRRETSVENSVAAAETATSRPVSEATAVDVVGNRSETSLSTHSQPRRYGGSHSLANPYRVIIDLPSVGFSLRPMPAAMDVVSSRPTATASSPKARRASCSTPPGRGHHGSCNDQSPFRHRRGPKCPIAPQAMRGLRAKAPAAAGKMRMRTTASRPADPHPPPFTKTAQSKPVIVIAPGHGGIDPGAVGAGNLLEKEPCFHRRKTRAGATR